MVAARLLELCDRLDLAEERVTALASKNQELQDRLGIRFSDEFRDLRADLERLRDSLEAGADEPSWAELADARATADELLSDSLAFIHGALTRSAEVDGGLCRVADSFLQDLAKQARLEWRSLTVLADTEFYENLAQIVRLRFAEASIWSLPIAAHEFGHFLGPIIAVEERDGRRWRYEHPLQELLDDALAKEGGGENQWARMHEYIADVFATYSVGPAYVYSCVLLRLDPTTPNREFRHPSAANRVSVMLETLDRLNRADPNQRPYSRIIDEIEGVWLSSVEAAGATVEADRGAALEAARFADIYERLEESVPATKYSSFSRVPRLQAELGPDGGGDPEVRAGDTIPDVLSAAWLARLDDWEAPAGRVGRRALEACLQIVDGGLDE